MLPETERYLLGEGGRGKETAGNPSILELACFQRYTDRVVTHSNVRRPMDAETRHRIMASIKAKDTKPELLLRQALRLRGLRGYRCHARDLPGSPDIVFTRWRVAVFVDGVWWHGHPSYFKPGLRGQYWDEKIARNARRDARVTQQLEELSWRVVRLWDVDVLRAPDQAATLVHDILLGQAEGESSALP